jgi:copper oxidase (laccase) domain-containing protein
VPNPKRFFTEGRDETHVQMDLKGIIRAQARQAGVLDIHIHTLPNCTFSESETFHSYRRDKANSGRQLSFIQLVQS